jgi:hypothetical protein
MRIGGKKMDIPVQTRENVFTRGKTARHEKVFPIQKGELYTINVHTMPVRVQALEGTLWVTMEGDPQDYLLTPCQRAVFEEGGRIVIQAVSKGKFRVTSE